MSLPVKLGLASVGAVGATATVYYGGSYLFNQPENNQHEQEEVVVISWSPLVEDSDFFVSGSTTQPSSAFSGKYGADYARFLIGTGSDSQSSQPNNSSVWDSIFEKEYKKPGATFEWGFKDLIAGAKTDQSNNKSIQEACDKVYKSDKGKIKSDNTITDEANEFKESQVWTLCSVLGSKPKTISATDNGSEDKQKVATGKEWGDGKWGSKGQDDLLAIGDKDNAKAWEELNRHYLSSGTTEGFFKREETNSRNIKDKCEDAYKVNSAENDVSKPKEFDLYKWCSLKGYKPTVG